MSDEAALRAAIISHPDDDTPRLVYADWLDEHAPDPTPSPAAGPSARAEYIRVQCRLARFPFDEPDYPELLERQDDLADWLNAHVPEADSRPEIPDTFQWYGEFDGGSSRSFDRGFPWVIEYDDYEDEGEENIDRITTDLPSVCAHSTARALSLENAYGSEVAGILTHPSAEGLRGFGICDLDDDDDSEAARGVATSPHLTNLRHLRFDIALDSSDLKGLVKAHLPALESFTFDSPRATNLPALGAARWFRNLRTLQLWFDDRDTLKALADLPPMPNLVSLTLRGSAAPPATAVRRFVASAAFPRLARLELGDMPLTPALVELFAGGQWPLRHLKVAYTAVQKAGAEALADAPFADTLRVLDLRDCRITAGGIQALAASERLAQLRHLNLSLNPLGAGGLFALARSAQLRGLRGLALDGCGTAKVPLDAATVVSFLSALEMPELRYLKLDNLPVCLRGARVLAAGATFAHLTRLSLNECRLGEKGARAIVESPVFADLATLEMRANSAGPGASKLANPKVFPRLGRADLRQNRIPKGPSARLRKRAGIKV
jgi:uncharacterized protein (TIGR02996 family)